MSKRRSNKQIKQIICDTLRGNVKYKQDKILKAWFSDECPLQCIGKRPNGKFEYINLHILVDGGLKCETNFQVGVVSIKGES